jgi:hypothetical protein
VNLEVIKSGRKKLPVFLVDLQISPVAFRVATFDRKRKCKLQSLPKAIQQVESSAASRDSTAEKIPVG